MPAGRPATLATEPPAAACGAGSCAASTPQASPPSEPSSTLPGRLQDRYILFGKAGLDRYTHSARRLCRS